MELQNNRSQQQNICKMILDMSNQYAQTALDKAKTNMNQTLLLGVGKANIRNSHRGMKVTSAQVCQTS